MSPIDPNVSAFQQAWVDLKSHLARFMIGVGLVTVVVSATSGIVVPGEGVNVIAQVFTGALSALLALVAVSSLTYLVLLLVAPIRQRNVGRQRLKEREDEIARLRTPRRKALFSVRVPQQPRIGNIDKYGTAHFDQVLVTDLSREGRILRFGLSMPDREFLDFSEYQEIHRDHLGTPQRYLSNPLDLTGNQQGSVAFVHRPGSEGVGESWELAVEDVHSGTVLTISELGEHVCYEDPHVGRA